MRFRCFFDFEGPKAPHGADESLGSRSQDQRGGLAAQLYSKLQLRKEKRTGNEVDAKKGVSASTCTLFEKSKLHIKRKNSP